MKKILNAVLLAITLCTPAAWCADPAENGGAKKPVDFAVSSTEGYREGYAPGEQISLQVTGTAPEPLAVEPQTGFHVQAMILSDRQSTPLGSANGSYDAEKHAWLVTLNAPNEASDSYRLVISLYCVQQTGPCVDTYGQAAQVQKVLPLQVR